MCRPTSETEPALAVDMQALVQANIPYKL